MSELGALEKLAIELTNSRGEAISLGDDLLVFLLSMAILHVRKRSAACEAATSDSSAPVHYLPNGPTERILLSLFAQLSQFRNKVDSGCAMSRIADSHEGA